ncbi:MAG: CopG family transcriptional regulator [Spirulinaceae cyanobacterium RM2_2_10]|nr:CopG family transcriptional regulator [Spirulinaceae cyanobacterium SM2_1_0]NJO20881.1 CopG family transcriptional regulator [Spirulinaceae cyanobacterium RM2_2_10]
MSQSSELSRKKAGDVEESIAAATAGSDHQVEAERSQSVPVKEESVSLEDDLIAQLQLPKKEATFRYTVDLSESLHRKLTMAAVKTGRSKADIVRYLLQQALGD